MRVRLAKADEFALIKRMDKICFPLDNPLADTDGSTTWIVIELPGGELVAYAGVKRLSDDPEVAYLSRAGVLPEYRGKRLQRRLIYRRVQIARAWRCSQVITYTAAHNIPSSNSLIRAGFKLYNPEYKWGLPHSLYWYRRLIAKHP